MEDKKFVILIYSGMGALLIGLLVMLYLSIRSNSERSKSEVDYQEIEALNPDEKIFSSKTEAYKASDRDSLLRIREENMNVDFSKLFKDDKQVQDRKAIKSKEESVVSRTPESYSSTKISKRDNIKKQSTGEKSTTSITTTSETAENQETMPKRREGFYSAQSFSNSKENTSLAPSSLSVVVHGRQEVYQGATVKMRTIDEFQLKGIIIPAHTFVYGICSFNNERVKINVQSIRHNNSLYSLKYSAYDQDGIEGVYVPGLIINDMAKESTRQAINEVDLDLPHGVSVPVKVASKNNDRISAILTDQYKITLK